MLSIDMSTEFVFASKTVGMMVALLAIQSLVLWALIFQLRDGIEGM